MANFYIDTACENTSGFDSGYDVFNEYLWQDSDHAVIHHALDCETDDLIAYFSLLSSALLHGEPAKLNVASAIELKMFAMDKRYHGSDLSSKLLDAVITTIEQYANIYVGAEVIVLYSVPASAVVNLYKSKGFVEIDGDFTAFKSTFTEGCIPMYKLL
ncbi:MAG: hypothetical protein FWC20_11685 [Oscillospiraceae bacterium]|nr:hypothetical protein [Oscillospiraceae bacterium]MCL2280045.1 hypothetical protein [Oscillospiraceae bacterium]